MKNPPKVVVVVPTKNSQLYLNRVLRSVLEQTYQNIDIVVVDNNSIDETKKIAKKFTNNIINFGPERSPQKNYGANNYEAKYILFLDSDAELELNVVTECVKLGEQCIDMVIIPERHKGKGAWAKAKIKEREFYIGDDNVECPWFFNRDSFLSTGGYDESMVSGEDWDIFNRMRNSGFKFSRCESYINHNLGQLKFFEYINKKRYYGRNIGNFINKNQTDVVKKIPFLRLSIVKNIFKNIHQPITLSLILILKFGEIIFIIIGMIEGKLKKNEM
jgi:glycosyltransferase involved in cell wall biosynthesis